MTDTPHQPKTILMIAYSYYEQDPRVIREAEAAVDGGFDVDFLALRKEGSLPRGGSSWSASIPAETIQVSRWRALQLPHCIFEILLSSVW